MGLRATVDATAALTATSNVAAIYLDAPTDPGATCVTYGLYIEAGWDVGFASLSPLMLSSLILAPTTDPTPYILDFQMEGFGTAGVGTAGVYTQGRVINMEYGAARTLDGGLIGINIDFSTNLTHNGQTVQGIVMNLNTTDEANSSVGVDVTKTLANTSGGAVTMTNAVIDLNIVVNSAVAGSVTTNSGYFINMNYSGSQADATQTFSGGFISMSSALAGGTLNLSGNFITVAPGGTVGAATLSMFNVDTSNLILDNPAANFYAFDMDMASITVSSANEAYGLRIVLGAGAPSQSILIDQVTNALTSTKNIMVMNVDFGDLGASTSSGMFIDVNETVIGTNGSAFIPIDIRVTGFSTGRADLYGIRMTFDGTTDGGGDDTRGLYINATHTINNADNFWGIDIDLTGIAAPSSAELIGIRVQDNGHGNASSFNAKFANLTGSGFGAFYVDVDEQNRTQQSYFRALNIDIDITANNDQGKGVQAIFIDVDIRGTYYGGANINGNVISKFDGPNTAQTLANYYGYQNNLQNFDGTVTTYYGLYDLQHSAFTWTGTVGTMIGAYFLWEMSAATSVGATACAVVRADVTMGNGLVHNFRGFQIDLDGTIAAGEIAAMVFLDGDGVTAGAGETFYWINIGMSGMTVGGTINAIRIVLPQDSTGLDIGWGVETIVNPTYAINVDGANLTLNDVGGVTADLNALRIDFSTVTETNYSSFDAIAITMPAAYVNPGNSPASALTANGNGDSVTLLYDDGTTPAAIIMSMGAANTSIYINQATTDVGAAGKNLIFADVDVGGLTGTDHFRGVYQDIDEVTAGAGGTFVTAYEALMTGLTAGQSDFAAFKVTFDGTYDTGSNFIHGVFIDANMTLNNAGKVFSGVRVETDGLTKTAGIVYGIYTYDDGVMDYHHLMESISEGVTGPVMQLYHNSASAASNDYVGIIEFQGRNAANSANVMYAEIRAIISGVGAGAETGFLEFWTARGGASTLAAFIDNVGTMHVDALDGGVDPTVAELTVFDAFDDISLLRGFANRNNVDQLVELNIMSRHNDMTSINIQNTFQLIAGGIYQNRDYMDEQFGFVNNRFETLEDKVNRLERDNKDLRNEIITLKEN